MTTTRISLYVSFTQPDNIKKIISATANEVDSYWPGSFARALKGRNVGDLLANVGSAAPAAAAAPTAGAAAEDDKKDEEPAKADEPEEVEMGNLFGDDDEEDY